jgi:hypothetical protein
VVNWAILLKVFDPVNANLRETVVPPEKERDNESDMNPVGAAKGRTWPLAGGQAIRRSDRPIAL